MSHSRKKFVYSFEESRYEMRHFVGNKGANLGEMMSLGLPVPHGFNVTTEACLEFLAKGAFPYELEEELREHVQAIEKKTGKQFGGNNPLLLSVRSGATISMPGMMDTVLNLGLNDRTVAELARLANDERFALDAYRRFIQMFGSIVLGIERERFESRLTRLKQEKGARSDAELDAAALRQLVSEYKEVVGSTGMNFPQGPYDQLQASVKAVFNSWNGKRCVDYRREFNITPDIANGTGVTVQMMVFGNMGNGSATGVAFTRDPGTGEKVFYGEYLANAQGEDVVAGVRTPRQLGALRAEMPRAYDELEDIRKKLEGHYHEIQDIEFTVERGKLYMLQTRSGKMNARATLKTSVDMVNEGLITKHQAVLRMRAEMLEQLFHPQIDPRAKLMERGSARYLVVNGDEYLHIGAGLAASPGAASGSVVFSADMAEELGKKAGKKVILVREETKPDDIHGFFASQGILTSRGGMTSHAAVVARGMGKPSVVGLEAIAIDETAKEFRVGSQVVKVGDTITLDGSTGRVYLGAVPLVDSELIRVLTGKMKPEESRLFGEYRQFMSWVDESRKLGVRANTDTPDGAIGARKLGAEGIGLCRTERMFNATDRLPIVRSMILAPDLEERKKQLEKLQALQKSDFIQILEAMDGLPVTIRLLDPPLHEFLPRTDELLIEIFELKNEGASPDKIGEKEKLLDSVRDMWEVNPMMGHRGVRLGITNPEIYEMQVRAILAAAQELRDKGKDPRVEIMVPNVGSAEELRHIKERIIDRVAREDKITVHFAFGTMMEVVRSCLTAGRIAEIAEFFSFGTNDLTQGTYSFSREDAEKKFIPSYIGTGILKNNPFAILDREGVGELIKMAVEKGRRTRPDLKVGICGEHGGEPSSVEFCHGAGLNYVSCSPYRVPIAKLAAAHGKLKEKK